MPSVNARSLQRVSTISTLVDALVTFRRGRRKSGALLLGAAVLSSRVPWLGTASSLLLRIARRLR